MSSSLPVIPEEVPHIINLSDKQVKFVCDPSVVEVVALSDVIEVVTENDLSQYGFVKVGKDIWRNGKFINNK